MHAPRRLTAVIVFVSLLVVVAAPASAASYPGSMASTGDSITRAFNTAWIPYVDNPSRSWSTGSTSIINSHYLRLLRLNPAISGRNYNDAWGGARMADLAPQMRTVVSQHVDYVTVLMGGNDLCTSTVGGMTSVATFRAQFTAAMNTVTAGLPNARVFVASVPNAFHLWDLFKNNGWARSVWSLFHVCPSLLANPLSYAAADVARRLAVYQRTVDFNQVLAQTCALYARCRFDGNALFNTAFTAADITGRDYFHPSAPGQAKLASITWAASYWAGS